jgi:hypothetical protein
MISEWENDIIELGGRKSYKNSVKFLLNQVVCRDGTQRYKINRKCFSFSTNGILRSTVDAK